MNDRYTYSLCGGIQIVDTLAFVGIIPGHETLTAEEIGTELERDGWVRVGETTYQREVVYE